PWTAGCEPEGSRTCHGLLRKGAVVRYLRGKSRTTTQLAQAARDDAEKSDAPGSRRTRGRRLRAGSSRLVVGLVGARQRDGTRTRQVGRGIHRGVARGRDAEHRGERGVRRDVREERPPWRAILGDRAAGRAAEAAHVGTRTLASAESAGPNAGARGAGGERRESDAKRADVRAVTAGLVCPAGAVTGNADAGRDAVRIGRARGRRIVEAVADRDAGAGSTCGRAVRIDRARGQPRRVTLAEG